MARTSAAVAAETGRRIADVASELFARHGFAGVSLDDVAQAAGVTRGAVYHHYRSKAGLFGAVAERLQASVAEAVVSAAEAAGVGADERLRAVCHAFLDAITDGHAARVLLLDAPAVLGWARWRQLDAESSVVHLRAALESAAVPAGSLEAMTAQLSGAMNEAALWLVERPEDDGARDEAHRVLDRLLAAAAPARHT